MVPFLVMAIVREIKPNSEIIDNGPDFLILKRPGENRFHGMRGAVAAPPAAAPRVPR